MAGIVGLLVAGGLVVVGLVIRQRIGRQRLRAEWRAYRALVAIVSRTARVGSTARLCRLMVSAINRTLRLTHSALLLWEAEQERFILVAVRPKHLFPDDLAIDRADPLMAIIRHSSDPWRGEDLHRRRARRQTAQDLDPVRDRLQALETKLVVPIASHGHAIAVLLMGRKRTGQPYTNDDLALLAGLAGQMAVGIEHARLVDALKADTTAIAESEKLASLGRLISGMAHAIHNPLTVISGEAQLYLERSSGQDPDVDRLLRSVIEECERAVGVTRRVSRFAKSASPEPAPVDLGEVVNASLALAGYRMHLDSVEQEIMLPPDLPPVRGSANQLQHAFFNLIVSACQAIGREGGRLGIEATSSSKTVDVRISYTKPSDDSPSPSLDSAGERAVGKKESVGDLIVQRIIQAHQGSLEIRTSGQTTTVTIQLPRAQNQATASSNLSSDKAKPALV
ncbi:MAG: GAF domain-containing protein [Candidatus Omnitrophica bacterium]|nr:GAF domain-containing protein [Candidatus Omnitrophota bacterium]